MANNVMHLAKSHRIRNRVVLIFLAALYFSILPASRESKKNQNNDQTPCTQHTIYKISETANKLKQMLVMTNAMAKLYAIRERSRSSVKMHRIQWKNVYTRNTQHTIYLYVQHRFGVLLFTFQRTHRTKKQSATVASRAKASRKILN